MVQPQKREQTQGPSDSSALPQPLGPDSHTWQNFGSYLFHLMLPQAFVLQSAHPIIDLAVSQEKKYKYDPWGRAKDSTRLLWPVIYARPEKATAMGIRLRELHRTIKGVAANGKKYHALDPEAYSWVHITGFDATLRMFRFFGREVSEQERAELFSEWQRFGRMLGIHEKHIPATEAAYWEHFNYIIEQRLEWGEVLDDLMDPRFYAGYPKPEEMKRVPDALFKAMMSVMGWVMHKVTVATLPDNFRRKFGVRYSANDQRIFKVFAWSVRTFYPLLPERRRYIPLAWRAIEDSRRHPEAYQFEADINSGLATV